MPEPIAFGDSQVAAGTSQRIELRVARLPTGDWLSLPVVVLHGAEPGPALWIDAAIHGDELNGMEVIRRVIAELKPREMCGTVYAVPVVNVFGLIHQTRYLPDRRDLNRSFPGSARGSLAGRLAHLFVSEIVDRCQFGIDLHTGSMHRTNLPQVRFSPEHPETRTIAEVFAAPLIYHSKTISGSLRATAHKKGVPLLVYEGGEPLRFNPAAIEVGYRGCLRVLKHLGMWDGEVPAAADRSFESTSAKWIRANRSGVFHPQIKLGEMVSERQQIGWISDPFTAKATSVRAPSASLVIGHTNNPLVYRGDALVHLASGF